MARQSRGGGNGHRLTVEARATRNVGSSFSLRCCFSRACFRADNHVGKRRRSEDGLEAAPFEDICKSKQTTHPLHLPASPSLTPLLSTSFSQIPLANAEK